MPHAISERISRFSFGMRTLFVILVKFGQNELSIQRSCFIKYITINNVQMDYINTSHPNFIGGSKAVENALQQVKSSRVPLTVSRQKV